MCLGNDEEAQEVFIHALGKWHIHKRGQPEGFQCLSANQERREKGSDELKGRTSVRKNMAV